MEQNREQDWYIMRVRHDVLTAEKEVARKKGYYAALKLQRKQRVWESTKQLTIVRNDAEG